MVLPIAIHLWHGQLELLDPSDMWLLRTRTFSFLLANTRDVIATPPPGFNVATALISIGGRCFIITQFQRFILHCDWLCIHFRHAFPIPWGYFRLSGYMQKKIQLVSWTASQEKFSKCGKLAEKLRELCNWNPIRQVWFDEHGSRWTASFGSSWMKEIVFRVFGLIADAARVTSSWLIIQSSVFFLLFQDNQ